MPVWRNARQRRLYGKPEDPIESPATQSGVGSRSDGAGGDGRPDAARHAAPAAPAPPKRVKREKTRPESEYELVHGLPATPTPPDPALLSNPLDAKKSGVLAYAIHASRQNWLAGSMFETFWTRKPKGRKLEGGANLREKMTKLHECRVTLGPHTFPVKLFTVRDDNVGWDEEEDSKVEALLREKEGVKSEPEIKTEIKTEADLDAGGEVKEGEKPEKAQTEQAGTTETGKAQSNEPTESKSESDAKPESLPEAKPEGSEPNESKSEEAKSEEAKSAEAKSEDVPKDVPMESPPVPQSTPTIPPTNPQPEIKPEIPDPETKTPEAPEKKGETEATSEGSNELKRASDESGPPPKKRRGRKKGSKNATSVPAPTQAEQTPEQASPASAQAASPSTAAPQTAPQADLPAHPAASQSPQPQTPQAPQAPPPQEQPQAQAPPPNQLVVYKLQQMAAQDPSLSELMREVASGAASPERVQSFQNIINHVKALIAAGPELVPVSNAPLQRVSANKGSKPPRAGSESRESPKPKPQQRPVVYQPRPNAKAIMLAIEFEESPTDRFLLPKRSIIEFVPEKEELLWSFLHVADKTPQEIKEHAPDVFTPVTAVFHDVPLRIAQTLERCVRRPAVVRHYMEQTLATGVRAQPWHLWFTVEKNDEVLLDLVRRSSAPTLAPPPAPKKPTRKRPKALTMAQQRQEAFLALLRAQRSQPLPVGPMFSPRSGEPFITATYFIPHFRSVYQQMPMGPMGPMGPMYPMQPMQMGPMQMGPMQGMPMQYPMQPMHQMQYPMQGMQGQPQYPIQGMPMQGMPSQGMPKQEMPMQGVPMQGVQMQGMPTQGMPIQGGMPVQGGMQGMPVPGTSTPGQPAPTEPTPTELTPTEPTPTEPMPAQPSTPSEPAESMAGETAEADESAEPTPTTNSS